MRKFTVLALALFFPAFLQAGEYKVESPSGDVVVTVSAGDCLEWSVSYKGELIIEPSPVGMEFSCGSPTDRPVVKKSAVKHTDRVLTAVVPVKFREVRDCFNELELVLKGGMSVFFRAYDNGTAYRFVTDFKDDTVFVTDEKAEFRFADDCVAYWPNEKNPDFISHCEAFFKPVRLSETNSEEYAYLPVSMLTSSGTRVVVTESDLNDYPNMFLFGGNGKTLVSEFPVVNLETELVGDRNEKILKKADYIAETSGKRAYPWRLLTLGDDRSLLENSLAWQLASPEVSDDTDWIRPGLISWEWWCALNVYGVDFKAGVNTPTYKYYIDFAAKYGIEYILLDEGWSASTLDIKTPRPELDIRELADYAGSKGVGVILWTLWSPMRQDIEGILDKYVEWGVKGIKIDFMQRCDQDMVNFYEEIARECFERRLLVDFHGAFKPSGLQRKYPNVMTFEGVYGMEHDKCSYDISPEHDLVLPFTRMVAGPMDYTPGATVNATKEDFAIRWSHPMSQGTRAHQAALYIVYESPLQMLCDSPSNYYREPEFTGFITSVPTVWDETIALEAKAGDYLLMARRNGSAWYVAGLTDWSERGLSLNLEFLGDGIYEAVIFSDGVNADVWAEDFKVERRQVSSDDEIFVKMAPGGGWAAIIKPAGE